MDKKAQKKQIATVLVTRKTEVQSRFFLYIQLHNPVSIQKLPAHLQLFLEKKKTFLYIVAIITICITRRNVTKNSNFSRSDMSLEFDFFDLYIVLIQEKKCNTKVTNRSVSMNSDQGHKQQQLQFFFTRLTENKCKH